MNQEIVISGQSKSASPLTSMGTNTLAWSCATALLNLAKPGIVMAELGAAIAGMLLASPVVPAAEIFFLVFISVGLASGGAAMANGLIDAKSDSLMPRLAARCRALNLLGIKPVSVVASTAIGISLILAATGLNLLTTVLLGTAIISYLWLYTARLKRTSPWALLIGGIPGALPPLIGAAAVGSYSAGTLILAIIIYLWQLPHFCFLALQYQEQYRQASLPVFPLVYGERLAKLLILTSTALLIPVTISFHLLGSISQLCSSVLLLTGMALMVSSIWAVQQQARYRYGFLASLVYLVVLLLVLIADNLSGVPWHLL